METTTPRRMPAITTSQRIEGDLRRRLSDRQWEAGALLPGRRELAREYGVDLTTLQRAIAGLLSDGTLRVDGRRGTFVADGRPHTDTVSSARMEPISIGVVAGYHASSDSAKRFTHWPGAVIHAMERYLAEKPAVTVCSAVSSVPDGTPMSLIEQVSWLRDVGVDAYVCVFIDNSIDIQKIQAATGEGISTIFVGSGAPDITAPRIFYDSAYAGYQACRHLVEAGYRDILFVSPFEESWVVERLRGARQVADLPSAGAVRVRERIVPGPARELGLSQYDAGRAQAQRLLPELPALGIIAANDSVAHGIIDVAAEAGLKHGHDYAIIGFDDNSRSRTLGLTTLHPPLDAMGVEAGRVTLDAVQGRNTATEIRLRSYLIPRASTRKNKGEAI